MKLYRIYSVIVAVVVSYSTRSSAQNSGECKALSLHGKFVNYGKMGRRVNLNEILASRSVNIEGDYRADLSYTNLLLVTVRLR